MVNILKDTITTVKAELLGYKYITDFDYNSLYNMKLDYMSVVKPNKCSNTMSIELINRLLHHLTFSCNVKKDDPSIFMLLEGNGYKLLIDNDSFKHLSKSLDTAFEVWPINSEVDNIVIIHNSMISNLKSVKHNNVVCISDSTINVKHIISNTSNELLTISKSYINVQNNLTFRKDDILHIYNKKFILENSIVVANNIVFNYDNGDRHIAEGYNIKCEGSKVVMYLDKDSDNIGSKIIHDNSNSLVYVYIRKHISYNDLCVMIASDTFHRSDSFNIYYGTNNTGWLVIKPNKDIDFIITTPKLLNSINRVLRKNEITILDTTSIYSANGMLEMMYSIIKTSDDKETILDASDIKIILRSFIKNGVDILNKAFTK